MRGECRVAVSLVIPAGKPKSRAGKVTSQSPSVPKWPARSPSLAWVPASRPGRRTTPTKTRITPTRTWHRPGFFMFGPSSSARARGRGGAGGGADRVDRRPAGVLAVFGADLSPRLALRAGGESGPGLGLVAGVVGGGIAQAGLGAGGGVGYLYERLVNRVLGLARLRVVGGGVAEGGIHKAHPSRNFCF